MAIRSERSQIDPAAGPSAAGTDADNPRLKAPRPAGHEATGPAFRGGDGIHDSRYLEFFERFNAGSHFAAHDVLEHLWLGVRSEMVGNFYKGLIQLAGAFVHVRMGRRQPALRLLDLARERLSAYPDLEQGLDLEETRRRIETWRAAVARADHDPGWLEGVDRPQLPRPSQSERTTNAAATTATTIALGSRQPGK